jgi:cell division septation protein DedD
MPGTPQAVASADSQPQATAGPAKVRTLQVRPDGSVVVTAPSSEASAEQPAAQPAVPPLPTAGSGLASGVAITAPQSETSAAAPAAPKANGDPTTVASVSQTPQMPEQTASAAKQPAQAAAVAPAPLPEPKPAVPVKKAAGPSQSASAGDSSIFVVQVASRRSQAMALAAFADLQQKYTSLLGDYQPMIQSADLGNKGVWYRLRVGPLSKKADAAKLCQDLKRAGLRSCLVRPL